MANIKIGCKFTGLYFQLNFIPERRHIWHGILDDVIVPLEKHLLQDDYIIGFTSQDVRQGSEPLLQNFESHQLYPAIFDASTYCDIS